MTRPTDKLRGVALAAVVLVSVFAGTVAFAGTAGAANAEPTLLKAVEDGQDDGSGDEEITVVFDDQVVAAGTTDSLENAGDGFFTLSVERAGTGTTSEVPVEASAITPAAEGDGTGGSPTGEYARYEIDLTAVDGLDATDYTPADQVRLTVGDVEPASASPGEYTADPGTVPVDLTTKKIVEGTAAHASPRSPLRTYQGEQVLFETAASGDDTDVVVSNVNTGSVVLDGTTGRNSEELVLDTARLDPGTYELVFEDSGDRQYVSVSPLGLSASIRPDGATFDADENETFALSGSAVRGDKNDRTLEVAYAVEGNDSRHGRLGYSGSATFSEEFDFGGDLSANGSDDSDYTVTVTDIETGIEVTAGEFTVAAFPSADAASFDESPVENRGDVVEIPVDLDGSEAGAQATVAIGTRGETNYVTNVTVEDVDGDGEVVLEFNTFLAGASAAADGWAETPENAAWNGTEEMRAVRDRIVTAQDDDQVVSWRGERGEFVGDFRAAVNESTALPDADAANPFKAAKVATVDAGSYDLSVVANDAGDLDGGVNFTDDGRIPDDVDLLALRPRSTDGSTVRVVPADFEGDVDFEFVDENLDSNSDGVDGNFTVSDLASADELVVHQVSASGVEGPVVNRSSTRGVNATVAFLRELNGSATGPGFDPELNAFNASVRETDLGPNEGRDRFALGTDNFELIPDPDNDTYYMVVDLAAVEADLEDGQDWTAGFGFERYDAVGPVIGVEGDGVSESTWTYRDPDATLERTLDGVVLLRAIDRQLVAGETTVAPGTELTVRVRSTDDDGAFFETVDARVEPGRTFGPTTDAFADDRPGTDFTAEVYRGGDPISDEFDGRLVAAATGEINVTAQALRDSERQEVVVDSVTLSEGGFVAVRAGNATEPVVGTSEKLAPGSHENVRIDVEPPIDGSTTVIAIAHLDTDRDNRYAFERGSLRDRPYVTDGVPVADRASVGVETPTPTVTETPTPTPGPDGSSGGATTPTPEATSMAGDTPTSPTAASTAPEQVTDTDATTASDGPGFGVLAVFLALVAAALLAVRRRE
ncbi:hypothetical protein BRC64_02735 [Halobacteriales archaeon QH_10_67_22]|nr:MAG: hypothetical protein BRC64_02735 [Halobacteriales archaeon QH_10_67_22]